MQPPKIYLSIYCYFLLAFLGSCIGEDLVDDELIPQTLSITAAQTALEIGEQLQLNAAFTNEFGQPDNAVINWSSSDNQIINVNDQGLAQAVAPGQAIITAQAENANSNMLLLTVVGDPNAVASVTFSVSSLQLQLNESVLLQAEPRNLNGDLLSGLTVTWESNNPQVVSVDQNGMVQALLNGTAQITATVEGIASNPLEVTVGDNQRVGTFNGASGYTTEGMATLSVDGNGDLILELSDDFDTDFALGTYIYLSNTTSGASTRNNGLEIAEITTDGAASFNISELDSSIDISDFQYVVVLCRPASITFGFAELAP